VRNATADDNSLEGFEPLSESMPLEDLGVDERITLIYFLKQQDGGL
jgi:hypothetical protein